MDAADFDYNSMNLTLASPPGCHPPPPPNASLGDSPSLNPPETFCEWKYLANNSDLKKLSSDTEREKEKHKKKNTKTQLHKTIMNIC